MMLLDGKKIAGEIIEELKEEVTKLLKNNKRRPGIAAILVGNNPASVTYVKSKIKTCQQIGYHSELIHLNETISQQELIKEIHRLNEKRDIDGYIVQLPLPPQIDEQEILLQVCPDKDVDGFHPENIGKMALELPCFIPATPLGIIELLRRYNIETIGKHCVIVGRSHIVGTPVSILLSRNNNPGNATVTLTHSKTKNLKAITQQADILIVAVGKERFIDASYIKEGVVVIDVGIHRIKDNQTKSGYRLCGDVDFESVKSKCAAITPVPGGVGPMTIAALMLNTFQAYQRHESSK